jgi:peptidoglycan/xylan/chitin deacetylase (PgdA/CDA1 family)
MSNKLTIVMYHYVRQLEKTRYPNIKGRRTSEFKFQVDYFRHNYHPVTIEEVIHCIRSSDSLPPKAVLLTFDDGYLDHYLNCFPILFDAGIQGSFFPPAATAKRGELLDVNRLHFILAVANPSVLAEEVDFAIAQYSEHYKLDSIPFYHSQWAKPSRYDVAEIMYVKNMLQHVLPEELRSKIAHDMFARHISIDEKSFASELYANMCQFKVMQKSGMYVGSHGDSHYWLNTLDDERQRREIASSVEFLKEVGSPVDQYWVMCYPYGAWNDNLLDVLADFKCSLGLTTRVSKANLDEDNHLLLPRLDTNDFPIKYLL